jgi:hypothetical protein
VVAHGCCFDGNGSDLDIIQKAESARTKLELGHMATKRCRRPAAAMALRVTLVQFIQDTPKRPYSGLKHQQIKNNT